MKTSVRVFFKKLQKDDKKSIIQLELKGNVKDKQMISLMNMAGTIVDVDFLTSQTDIDDYQEPHEGVEYKVNPDGTAEVKDPNQAELDFDAPYAEVAATNETEEELVDVDYEVVEEPEPPIQDEAAEPELADDLPF